MIKTFLLFFMVSICSLSYAQLKLPKEKIRGMVEIHSEIPEPEAMQDVFEQLIQQHPDKPQGYTNLGGVKFMMKDYNGALQQFNKAMEISPSTDIRFNRGLSFLRLENFKPAVEEFQFVTTAFPNDAEALFALSYAQYKAGMAEKAKETLDQLLKLKPKDVAALNNRGYINYELKKFDAALADFNAALDIEKNDHQLFYNRGLVFLKTADNSKACKDLKAAVDLGNIAAGDLAKEACK